MGSISTPSGPVTARPPPEFDPSGHSIYAAFCLREPATTELAVSNWIDRYDPTSNVWSHISSIPGVREGHVSKGFAMVALESFVFVIGGKLCRKEMAHVADELAGIVDVEVEVLSSVYAYNVATGQWSELAPLRTPRSDFACAVCGNKIYVAGGQSVPASVQGISSAEVYDATLNEWTPLPHMYALRFKCVGVTWQGKIHVVGGFVQRPDETASPYRTERSSADVFDPKTGRWELMASMWQLDVPPNQIIAVDGRLFSSGDCLKTWKGRIEAYDESLNMWDEVEKSCLKNLPYHRNSPDEDENCWPLIQQLFITMAPIKTHIYFLGGYRMVEDPSKIISMVCTFDTTASASGNAWRSFEPKEEEAEKELCTHCCVVHRKP